MKIVFIQDYIGRETAMQEKKKGDELDCSVAIGLALIELGVAEEKVIEIEKPKKQRKIKEFDDD